MSTRSRVLVTGGAGFVAGHCIAQLLAAGHAVRTTVRSLAREAHVRATLAAQGQTLSFVEADLEADAGWAAAVAGCTHVLHVASPFPLRVPRHADDLVRPARDGSLRVLRAARDAGVARVVLTSSFAAIGYGIPRPGRPFDETDWSDPDGPGVTAYAKSKTLAERAAWDFIAREGGALELATVNPVVILGPLVGPHFASSVEIVRRLMDGALPGLPDLAFGVVDVRDVADLHLRAMTAPAAAGQRFLAVADDFLTLREIADILRSRLGSAAHRVPTRRLPDGLLRLAGLFDPAVRQILPELAQRKTARSDKAHRLLGWTPRPAADAIVATAESLLRHGVLKDKPQVG